MLDLFSDENRRNPYPLYDQARSNSPVLHVPQLGVWLIFDYEGVKRALTCHEAFSSAVPAPENWFIFFDPPRHTKLRALITRAFTPRSIENLESSIRELSRELLNRMMEREETDLAAQFSIPLPMRVIAKLIGIPPEDWPRFRRWSDSILKLSYSLQGGAEGDEGIGEFRAATTEMAAYLPEQIEQRRAAPRDDLLTRLVQAEIDGEGLTEAEILGFFQLLVVGGQGTTANLMNNAILCFLEHPDQLARLRSAPELLPQAIEEVLRYRSPLQWIMRTPRHEVEMHGQVIRPGELVLPLIGSANRDSRQFPDPGRFDITRDPNPHLAFGHGIHFCLGASLARLEARIARAELLARMKEFELASDEPWEPRKALHVHGPDRLPIRFEPAPMGVPA